MTAQNESKQRALDDYLFRSENASTTARNLSLSVIAVVWGFLTMSAAANNGLQMEHWQHVVLLLSGVVAATSLFADWLQAIAGYVNACHAWDRVNDPAFDPDDRLYQVNRPYQITTYSFWAKQVFAPMSFVLLMVALSPIVLWRI